MAKQTINIGAAPNDGTGTPLRTSFDYCNQNFTELYTATGPSGNNIVVPGSATITGDLTVDTSTLKVDSANNRVGIGTASPGFPLDIIGASGVGVRIYESSTGNNNRLQITQEGTETRFNSTFSTGSAFYTWQIASSEQMRLNSTGLGVGDSPFAGTRLTLRESATNPNALAMTNRNATQTWRLSVDVSAVDDKILGFYDSTSTTFRMQLTDTGNLGIGVTPSAWGSNSKALHVGGGSASVSSTGAGSTASRFAHGAYFDNTNWLYQYTGVGPALYQVTGANAGSTHAWYIAPGGTAGNAITFTQAMTLVASGDLGVGTTNPASDFGTVRSGFVATGASGAIGAKVDATGRACLIAWNADTAGDNNFVQFFTEAALTTRGSISYNRAGGLVAYNTTSDYRAKDIIGPVSSSGSLIDSLKVYVGKMKGATIERPMLIAHEAQEVAPYAVTGTKDEVDADGNPKYQQMDVSSFVPLLIAEIQSLRTRVQTLEAK